MKSGPERPGITEKGDLAAHKGAGFRRNNKVAKRGNWAHSCREGAIIDRSVGRDRIKRAFVSGYIIADDVVDLTENNQNVETNQTRRPLTPTGQGILTENNQNIRANQIRRPQRPTRQGGPKHQNQGPQGPKRHQGPLARPRCRPPSLSPPRQRTGARRHPPPEVSQLTGCRSLDGAIQWLRKKLG